MASEIDKIIEEQFHKLPPVIKDVVLNSNWQEKIRRIVQNNKLHLDQGAAIESVVILTMLGVYTPEDFVETAQKLARVTQAQAETISLEVEREIFHEIREKLIEITESHDTIDEVERVTNELTKVDDDIERGARDDHLDSVTMHSKATNLNLKEQPAILALREMNKQAEIAEEKANPSEKRTIELPKAPLPIFKKTIPLTRPTTQATNAPAQTPKTIVTLKPGALAAHNDTQQAPVPQISINIPMPKPAPTAVTKPAATEIAPKPPVAVFTPMPKSLDPIVAAKLGAPTASARDRLEMEVSDSVLKAGEVKVDAADIVGAGTGAQAKQYGSTDPYRETVA